MLLFLGNCSNSSSVSSKTNKPEGKKNSGKRQLSFVDSSPSKIEGKEVNNNQELMYSLTKTSDKNYKLLITTYKDSKDHRTIQTVYKSSVGLEKSGNIFTVRIRYAQKPNVYSWHIAPQNSFNQSYNLSDRSITYTTQGGLASKIRSQKRGKNVFAVEAMQKEKLIRMSLTYFIHGYNRIFSMK